jgi:hypothetical protein
MGRGLHGAVRADLYGFSQPEAHDQGFGLLVQLGGSFKPARYVEDADLGGVGPL